MAAELKTVLKLQIMGGVANPAPPIGPALGQHGVNIQEFCSKFNEATANKKGTMVPVEISVFKDGTFTFIMKQPPAQFLIKKALGIESGSGEPNKKQVGTLTFEQCRQIAKEKLSDMNTQKLESAAHMIAGTARSMGVKVTGRPGKE